MGERVPLFGMVNHSHGSPVNGMFENWGTGEPNGDSEDYLQISQAVQPDGTTGTWNDLRIRNKQF